jgi:SAM-dependent methyltransferase
MSTAFESPSHDALIAEQATVQAEKFQGRLLDEYSSYMFPGQDWREPRGSAVADFVRPITGDTAHASLEGLLAGLIQVKTGEPVHWVDMGGGRALPMRQLVSMPSLKEKLIMTNVDLFDYGLAGLEQNELEYLESSAPGITDSEAEPRLITENVETVQLPDPADLITSVEAMQYLNNPLEAVANWYNQLADNGIMIIATEHNWTSWIRYNRQPDDTERDETPAKHLIETLSRANITYAVTDETDWKNGIRPKADPDRTRIMAIQKKPRTSLRVTKPVTRVWVNPYNFKAAYYEAPSNDSISTVEVVKEDITSALGAVTLSTHPTNFKMV